MATRISAPAHRDGVKVLEARFVEQDQGEAATYTADFVLPANCLLVDIIVHQEAVWDDTTGASLDVGDAGDAGGFFTAVDLKATDLLADESISLQGPNGGVGGAYTTVGTNTHISDRFSAAERTITATVTATDGDGSAGRTRVAVLYADASPSQVNPD